MEKVPCFIDHELKAWPSVRGYDIDINNESVRLCNVSRFIDPIQIYFKLINS